MNDPSRVRVTGPLAPYVAGFRQELQSQGYAPGSAALQLQLVGQLSRWLDGQGLDVGGLTPQRVERFFELRRARVRVLQVSPKALRVLFEHLAGVGVLPESERGDLNPAATVVERYGRYLLRERALGERTAQRYCYVACRFLAACSAAGVEVGGIDAATITAFLTAECRLRSTGWAKCVAVALRSLLRFLYLEELITVPLAGSVPTPAGWTAAQLPTALTPADLTALLAGCDRRSTSGRRDYAVVVLAARLGLRAGEIAGLDLAEIDWAHGELAVRGKGRRVDRLPLPVDVGRALADYARNGRPCAGGAFFRRVNAPHGRLHPSTVTGIVYRACDRAGLARVGAHRLRHTAATQMLRAGASLPEIAQVLRHRSPNTTAIYAKVDRRALGELARRWPGGVA